MTALEQTCPTPDVCGDNCPSKHVEAPSSNERTPEVIPWERLKKMAERDGVNVSDYITSMNAHILNQRDEINKLTSRLAAALSFVPDNVNLSELRSAVETFGDSQDAARYRWLRRRIARTIIARISGAEPETEWAARPEALDGLIDAGLAVKSGEKP